MGVCFYFSSIFNQLRILRVRLSRILRFYHLAFVFFTSIYARFRKIWECNFIFFNDMPTLKYENGLSRSAFQRPPKNALTTSVIRIHVTSNICSSFRIFVLDSLLLFIPIYANNISIWEIVFNFSFNFQSATGI